MNWKEWDIGTWVGSERVAGKGLRTGYIEGIGERGERMMGRMVGRMVGRKGRGVGGKAEEAVYICYFSGRSFGLVFRFDLMSTLGQLMREAINIVYRKRKAPGR